LIQNIIDLIPIAIFLIDDQGYIQLLNRDAKSLVGEQADLNGSQAWSGNFEFFLDDENTPYPLENLPVSQSLLGKTIQNEEMVLCRKGDEQGIWISMSSQPVYLSDKSASGVIILIRDITYRKNIELSREKHIQRTETLYKLSQIIAEAGNDLDSTAQAVAKFTSEILGDLSIVMLEGDIDGMIKIIAFADSDSAGHTFMRKLFVNNNHHELDSGVVGGVIESGEPLSIPIMDSDHTEAITYPIFSEYVDQFGIKGLLIVPLTGRGGVLGAISVSRHHGKRPLTKDDLSLLMDIANRGALAIENCRLFESLREQISERLSTKEKLDVSEERFKAIFESTTLGIKLLDHDGNILQTNFAFQLMLGYSEVEFFGRHFSDFLLKSEVPRALRLVKDLKNHGTPQYLFEHRAVHKDGSLVWIKTTFSPVMRGNGSKRLAYIVGIVENISEQKKTEEEMKELSDRLLNNIEMERLTLAQELHDNPIQTLYSVIFQLERIRDTISEETLDAELKSAVEEVKNVINGLRNTAKELRPPTISEFGLENAIRSHMDDILEKYPQLKVSMSLAQDRQLLPEKTRLALFRLFQQSIMNIIRHSEATKVNVRFSFDALEVRLEVTDNGNGFEVPQNWVGYVRNGHYGLAGAAEKMSLLGGYLKVSSVPGKSTTILAVIPRKNAK
jgi:PAS domain S-box-containing protein